MLRIRLQNDPNLKKLLEKIKSPRTLQRILSSIAIELKSSTRARFFFSVDPEGRPWIPSRSALKEGRRTLVKSGRLRDSVNTNVTTNKIEVGIPRATIYGKKFQLGIDGQEQ
ncbi:MAG TPA: phage virion morphogenesis protein, partial [Flavobacterium alvei]|nr:phage virion morphogenesis protein [Flavobacterium alvei]